MELVEGGRRWVQGGWRIVTGKQTQAGEEWISLQLGNPVEQQQAHQSAVKDVDEQIPF